MTLPRRLQEKRDELAKEWARGWNPLADETNSVIALNYKKGFKDCAALLIPEIEKLREALPNIPDNCGEHTHNGIYLDHKDCDLIREALQSIEEFLNEK